MTQSLKESEGLLSQWDQADSQNHEALTVEQMDQLVQDLRTQKTAYDLAQEQADQIKAQFNEAKDRVLKALLALKRDNYAVDGHGLAYISRKEVYTTPKTNDDKNKLFTYIKEKYGPDALMGLVSINSQTLTSWANKETETGEVQVIPGLDQPTMIETLNFRKK